MNKPSSSFGAELNPHERAALAAWAEPRVPEGFAERVFDELCAESGSALCRPAHLPKFGLWSGPGYVAVVAVAAALAAALLLLVLPAGALQDQAAEVQPQVQVASAELSTLRQTAGVLLAEHCTPCHDHEAAGAQTRALDVFDVRNPQWWGTMSDAQLGTAGDELLGRGLPTSDTSEMTRYVAAELALRDARG